VCLLVSKFKSCWTYLEISIEGSHILAQRASDLCQSTAAQYIKIRVPQYRISKGPLSRFVHCVGQYRTHTYIYKEAKIDV